MTKPSTPRSTDRLIEALSTLAALLGRTINEVKSLDSGFQTHLLQAVHDTEISIQQQASENLQAALQEREEKVRSEASATIEDVRRELGAEREKVARQIAAWEGERTQLRAECEQLRQDLSRMPPPEEVEKVRAEAEAKLEATRQELIADRERAAHQFVAWENERTRLTTECERAQKELAENRAAAASGYGSDASESLALEVSRIEAQVKAINALIDDPATDLSTVIRKNVERAELESFLRGVRFAVTGK